MSHFITSITPMALLLRLRTTKQMVDIHWMGLAGEMRQRMIFPSWPQMKCSLVRNTCNQRSLRPLREERAGILEAIMMSWAIKAGARPPAPRAADLIVG